MQNEQPLRGFRIQVTEALLFDRDDVLDAHAEPARQVDSRFVAKAHPNLQLLPVSFHDVWRLVRGETDAVTGAVNEVLPVSGFHDDIPGSRVYRLASDARTSGVEGGAMRMVHDVVHLRCLGVRLAERDRARD